MTEQEFKKKARESLIKIHLDERYDIEKIIEKAWIYFSTYHKKLDEKSFNKILEECRLK